MAITLRLPPELHGELQRIAARDDRSLTAQIIRFLRQSAERDRREHQNGATGEPTNER